MPMKKQATTVNDPKPTDRSKTQKGAHISDLPAGLMGKLQVYRSGAVKLKLGDTVYDVSAFHKFIVNRDDYLYTKPVRYNHKTVLICFVASYQFTNACAKPKAGDLNCINIHFMYLNF